MIGRRCALIALGGLLILVLTVNIYFVRMIVDSSPDNNNNNNNNKYYTKSIPISNDKNNDNTQFKLNSRLKNNRKSITREIEEKIKAEMRLLPSKYFKRNNSYGLLIDRLLTELRIMPNVQEDIWNIPNNNVSNLKKKIICVCFFFKLNIKLFFSGQMLINYCHQQHQNLEQYLMH